MFTSSLPTIPANRLRSFKSKPEWYILDPFGLHGIAHAFRVLIWTQIIAHMEKTKVDPDVLGWAAVFHDIRRDNDGIDDVHGALSADWLEAQPKLLPRCVPVEKVSYLCRWHSRSDLVAPAMTAELANFKDADALDRFRFDQPDPAHLRTRSARKLLLHARDLAHQTRNVPDGFDPGEFVLSGAKKLGIVYDKKI